MNRRTDHRLYFDVETTGFDPMRNSVISLGAVIADNDFNIVDTYYEECTPDTPYQECPHLVYKNGKHQTWGKKAEEVHGLKWEYILKQQAPNTAIIKFLKFLAPYKSDNNSPLQMVYHANQKFDVNMLRFWLHKNSDLAYFGAQKVLNWDYHESTLTMVKEYNKGYTAQEKLLTAAETMLNKPRKRPINASVREKYIAQSQEAMNVMSGYKNFGGASLDKICAGLNLKLEHHNSLSDAKVLPPIHKFLSNAMK